MDVLVIDPPWAQTKGGRRSARPRQGRQLDYSTLSIEQIFCLLDQEFSLANGSPVVFLWCIDKFLFEAETAMKDRGYKLHARLVWDKGNGVAPAFTVRFSHEYLLWFYKSPMPPIAREQRGKYMTVLREAAREHSRKPDVAYDMVQSLYPDAVLTDVFSRENRAGWRTWGDQEGYFK